MFWVLVFRRSGVPAFRRSYFSVDVEWFSKTEKNFSLKEKKAHFLSLTQYSLGVELKFVECVNFCCWAWLKYAVTLKENPLNVTWFWWAWLKSLFSLIKNLLNVKTILLLEFCTIWLSIHVFHGVIDMSAASYKMTEMIPTSAHLIDRNEDVVFELVHWVINPLILSFPVNIA